MSRLGLTLTAVFIAALVLITAVAPITMAQAPQKYTRPLTLVAWEGSLIELYLNYTELANQYGVGPKGYQFAIAIPGTSTPLGGQPLPILVSDIAGKYYCTVGYVILNIGTANLQDGLWMSSSLPYIFQVGNYKYEIRVNTSLNTPGYGRIAVWNVTDPQHPQWLFNTKIHALVYFPDAGSLEAAIKASPLNKGVVPPGPCQALVAGCANGCYLRVYGVLISPPRGLVSGNKYSILVKTTASPTWSFEGGLYITAVNPATSNIVVNYDAGANYTIAFGRIKPQTVPLANGGRLTIKGMLNVTINWTQLRSYIENVYEKLSSHNISVTYRLFAEEIHKAIAETGLIRFPNNTEMNYTMPGSLLADSNTEPLIRTIYKGAAGAWNVTRVVNGVSASYIIINVTVDPNITLPVVNKVFSVKYGNLVVTLPGAYGDASIVVRVNETIYIGSTTPIYLTFGNLAVEGTVPTDLQNKPMQFWAIIAYLPLEHGLTILPGTLMAKGYETLDTTNVFDPGIYGDSNAMNAFDAYYVVITNMFSNNTKFFIGGKAYTFYGKESKATLDKNITSCAKLVSVDGEIAWSLWVNGTNTCIPIGNQTYDIKEYYGKLFFVYILPAKPYGGNMFYTVPMIAANLIDGTSVAKYMFGMLPPVNTSNVNLGGDASLASIGTIFRVRPYLAVYNVTSVPINGYMSLGGMGGDVTLGTWMVLFGVGFNTTDPKLTVWLGNYSISYTGLLADITYKLLEPYGSVIMPYNDTLALNNGTFVIVVPLWLIKSTEILNGAATGVFEVNITGSGYNSDAYNKKLRIVPPSKSIVMIEPRPVMMDVVPVANALNAAGILYYNWTPEVSIQVSSVKRNAANPEMVYKAPTEAYMLYRSLGGADEPLIYNATHMMVVVAVPPARAGTLYTLRVVPLSSNAQPNYNIKLVTLTADMLADGVYVNYSMSIPTVAYLNNGYAVILYNETSGKSCTTYVGAFMIAPIMILHSVMYHNVAYSFSVYNIKYGIVGEVLALPNDTVELYGYGWGSSMNGEYITVKFDRVPKIYTRPNADGVWEANYTVPPYKSGTTINVVASSSIIKDVYGNVTANIRVVQVIRNGLRTSISAWPVYYDDGTVKLPVIVTVTYYDNPATCSWPVTVYVMVYKDYSTTPQVYKLKCMGDGVWYGVIDLGTIDKPTFLLLVSKVEYKLMGITTLTSLASTGVSIDPDLKKYAASAAEAANNAAAQVAAMKSVVSNIDTLVKQIKGAVDTMNGKLDAISTKIDTLGTKLDSLSSAVADIKSSLSDTAAKVMAKLDAIASDIASVKKAIEGISTTISTTVSEALAKVATKDDIKNAVSEIKNSIVSESTKITNAITNVKNDIAAMIDALPGQVVKALGDKINSVLAKIDEVKTALGDISKKLENVATKDDIKSVKTSIETAAADMKNAIKELSNSVKAINSNINTLSTKIDSVRSAVNDLMNSVKQVKSSVDNVNTSTMIFGAATLVVSIIVLILLIIVAVKEGLLRSG